MTVVNLTRFIQLFTLHDTVATQRLSERLALRDRAAYQEQFAEELEECGIIANLPAQELRDLALLDAAAGRGIALGKRPKRPGYRLVLWTCLSFPNSRRANK